MTILPTPGRRTDQHYQRAGIANRPVSQVGVAIFVLCLLLGVAGAVAIDHPAPILAALPVGLYFLFAVKVARQWEKVAVLRLGRYVGLRGPGMFFIIPVIDSLSRYLRRMVLRFRVRMPDSCSGRLNSQARAAALRS